MKAVLKIVVPVIIIGAIGAFIYAKTRKEPIVQPIDFNHAKHVKGNGMACQECHKYVGGDHMASIPNIETCKLCHTEDTLPEDAGSKQKLLKVVEYVNKKEQIPWVRLFQVPDHVYFSHRTHTVFAKISCEECHGDMGSQTSPMAFPYREFTMDDCINCHRDRKVTEDCIACHK